MVAISAGLVLLNLYRNVTVPIPIRSILFGKTGIKDGSVQMDKTNPEELKMKDLLFISIKYTIKNSY
jgi:hypothetical protein